MDKTAQHLAAEVLELASESFSNHGCNDFALDDTPTNRSFVTSMYAWSGLDEGTVPYVTEGKLWVQDWMVMSYCAYLLRREAAK